MRIALALLPLLIVSMANISSASAGCYDTDGDLSLEEQIKKPSWTRSSDGYTDFDRCDETTQDSNFVSWAIKERVCDENGAVQVVTVPCPPNHLCSMDMRIIGDFMGGAYCLDICKLHPQAQKMYGGPDLKCSGKSSGKR